MSRVACHVSRVTCHMSRVIIIIIIFFFGHSGEAIQGRVCYQRGPPRLVLTTQCLFQPWSMFHVALFLLLSIVDGAVSQLMVELPRTVKAQNGVEFDLQSIENTMAILAEKMPAF